MWWGFDGDDAGRGELRGPSGDRRVEFGRRLTWNVARREFGLSANQPSMAVRLPAPVAPTVARSLP